MTKSQLVDTLTAVNKLVAAPQIDLIRLTDAEAMRLERARALLAKACGTRYP